MHATPPGPARPAGRRERKKQRVKERLYASALSLFAENGYDRTSIDEIAARADVARGTFFNYFQRKEDLITAWGDQRRERLRERLDGHPDADSGAIAQLERCMEILSSINEEERELTVAMLTAWVKAGRPLSEEPYVGDMFAGIVAAGQEKGEFSAGIPAGQTGTILRDVYLGALYRWCRHPDADGSLNASLRTALGILLHGITAPDHHRESTPVS
jgi:TetR/AcrR family transcriptional regulator, cholesterol catabolism regulator